LVSLTLAMMTPRKDAVSRSLLGAKAAIESGAATLPYPSHYPLQSVNDVFNG